jgi:hypothetical protein
MNEPQWTPPTKAQLAAADQFINVITSALTSDRGVHAETAIAGAARMAGTFLFRSFNFQLNDVAPGTAVFSDAANDRGPLLLQTLGTALISLGFTEPQFAFGGKIPEESKPLLSVIETQTLLEASLHEISEKHGLTLEEAAHACAIVAARLIQICTNVLEPRIAFAVAAYGFVEGSKTMPGPLTKDVKRTRGWFKWIK